MYQDCNLTKSFWKIKILSVKYLSSSFSSYLYLKVQFLTNRFFFYFIINIANYIVDVWKCSISASLQHFLIIEYVLLVANLDQFSGYSAQVALIYIFMCVLRNRKNPHKINSSICHQKKKTDFWQFLVRKTAKLINLEKSWNSPSNHKEINYEKECSILDFLRYLVYWLFL